MDILPTELRRQILTNCNILAIQCLRLTCKNWAALGLEYLGSSTFTTLPHRPDYLRLLYVSEVPVLAQQIEFLHINLGEMDDDQARHNLCMSHGGIRDVHERFAAQNLAWAAYTDYYWLEKEKFKSLACSPIFLDPALPNLPNLKRVAVTLTTCPFPEDAVALDFLRLAWDNPSSRLLPRVATTERFASLCSALAASPARLQELSHDRLPYEFFGQESLSMADVLTVFEPLTKLSLSLAYPDTPDDYHMLMTLSNLATCLRSASSLQSLSLSFTGKQFTDESGFRAAKKIDVGNLFSALAKRRHVFSNLRELRLEGVRCTENTLLAFLARHSGSLRKLQLGGVGVREPYQRVNGGVHLQAGTWRSAFERVHEALDLWPGSFLVQGDFADVETNFVLDDLTAVEELGGFVRD